MHSSPGYLNGLPTIRHKLFIKSECCSVSKAHVAKALRLVCEGLIAKMEEERLTNHGMTHLITHGSPAREEQGSSHNVDVIACVLHRAHEAFKPGPVVPAIQSKVQERRIFQNVERICARHQQASVALVQGKKLHPIFKPMCFRCAAFGYDVKLDGACCTY